MEFGFEKDSDGAFDTAQTIFDCMARAAWGFESDVVREDGSPVRLNVGATVNIRALDRAMFQLHGLRTR